MRLLLIAVMLSVLSGCVGYIHDRGNYQDRDRGYDRHSQDNGNGYYDRNSNNDRGEDHDRGPRDR